jgi:hypothetical protein
VFLLEAKMPEPYTFYIDDGRDSGTGNVRSGNQGGASPYMTLAGVFVQDSDVENLKKCLVDLTTELSVHALHCSVMNHSKKVQ